MTSFSLCLTSKMIPSLVRRRLCFNFFSGGSLRVNPRNCSVVSLSASLAEKNTGGLDFAWVSWDGISPNEYNGWGFFEESASEPDRNGFRAFVVAGAVASIVGAAGLLAFLSVPTKVPLSNAVPIDAPSEEISSNEQLVEGTKGNAATAEEEIKPARIFLPSATDSTQQESLLSLKKLRVVEDDVQAEELCTRREYARWLVRANSQLERSRKHRINTSAVLSGSSVLAFDDVGVEDPDFEFIQSLAEAGVVRSKLSIEGEEGSIYFSPDRFISRWDLITWRAKLEYEPSLRNHEEMSRNRIDFLDVRNLSPELHVDVLADERSITGRVFGRCKRFQAQKPCTKAQAAVALKSGRMTKLVDEEIARIEAEALSRQSELREVMSEVVEKGDIKQHWERRIEEERTRKAALETEYRFAVDDLEREKSFLASASLEMAKQRASLDCQKELLSGLRSEVDEMSEKLSFEKGKCIDEGLGLKELRRDLEAELARLRDAEAILESQVEAARILRGWVEEEARKNQNRSQILETAVRRWKWDS